MSDSPGLVDFTIGLVNSVFNLPDGKVIKAPKASSLPVLFTSKIRDREEGIAIYSFYTWFSFLTWV